MGKQVLSFLMPGNNAFLPGKWSIIKYIINTRERENRDARQHWRAVIKAVAGQYGKQPVREAYR